MTRQSLLPSSSNEMGKSNKISGSISFQVKNKLKLRRIYGYSRMEKRQHCCYNDNE